MAWRASSTASTVTTGSTSITIPAAVQIGDTMVLWGTVPSGGSITTPSGWAAPQTFTGASSTGNACLCYLWKRVATAADVGGSTVVSMTTNGFTAIVFGASTNIGAVTSTATLSTVDGTTATSPSLTTVDDGSDILELFGTFRNVGTAGITPPVTVEINVNSTGSASSISYQAQVTHGASGSKTATLAVSGSWVGLTAAISPIGPVLTPVLAGLSSAVSRGALW